MATQRPRNPFLRYCLRGITQTNMEIGRGSYAVVEELYFHGLSCVGKSIHRELYDNSPPRVQAQMLERFEEECNLLSQIRHPHIVQFLGVHFKEAVEGQGGVSLPVIVMERLHCTLTSTIDRHGRLPEEISHPILREVATGLAYLHARPIIHRDLSANNVLLATNMSAKISDLGMAKILDLSPARMVQMTTCPGTLSYMPPEALTSGRAVYTTKIDIFSYGNLMTHVLSGEWPIPTQAFQFDPNDPKADPIPITEAERREEYLRAIGNNHALMGLIRQCLSNNPAARPEASDVLVQLKDQAPQHPLFFTDRVEALQRISERVADNHKQVRLHRQEQEQSQREVEQLQREVEEVRVQGNERVQEKEQQLEQRQQQIEQLVVSHQLEVEGVQAHVNELRKEGEGLRENLRAKEEEVEAAEALARARGEEASAKEEQHQREMESVRAQGEEQVHEKQLEVEQKQQRIDQLILSHTVEIEGIQVRVSELSGECEALKAGVRAKEEEVKAANAMVKAKEREATAKEEELSAVRQELAAKEEVLEAKEGELWTLEQQLGLKNQQLSLKDNEILAKTQQLEFKSQWLVLKQSELSSKDSQLATKDKEIASRDLQLAAEEAEVADRNQDVVSLRQKLMAKKKELEAAKYDLATVKASLDDRKEAIGIRDRQLAAKQMEVAKKQQEVVSMRQEVTTKEGELSAIRAELATLKSDLDSQKDTVAIRDHQLTVKEAEIASKKEELASVRQELILKEKEEKATKNEIAALRGKQDAQKEAIAARDSQLRAKEHEIASKDCILATKESTIAQLRSQSTMVRLLNDQAKLRWKRCTDIPRAMSLPQVVRINNNIYVGGGCSRNAIFRYNPAGDAWSILPENPTGWFGLTELNGKLVLVGGLEDLDPTSDVYTLEESGEWEKTLPALPTARWCPTVFRYVSFLIACGGSTDPLSGEDWTPTATVEVLDSKITQWYSIDPLPFALFDMSCAIIDDTCYLIRGNDRQGSTNHTICASLSSLIQPAITQADSQLSTNPQSSATPPSTIWKELPECPCKASTAAVLGGCLLAIGGYLPDASAISASVFVYSHSTNSWVRVPDADIPQPRYRASATQLANGDLILIGGLRENGGDHNGADSATDVSKKGQDYDSFCSSVFISSIAV